MVLRLGWYLIVNNRSEVSDECVVNRGADSIHDSREEWGSDGIQNDFTCWFFPICFEQDIDGIVTPTAAFESSFEYSLYD